MNMKWAIYKSKSDVYTLYLETVGRRIKVMQGKNLQRIEDSLERLQNHPKPLVISDGVN